jgi:Na+/phosphate symporter
MPFDPAEPGEWISDSGHRNMVIVALNLVPFAGIAFLWFIGVIRDRLGDYEDRFFATVFLGSGLLFVAMLFASEALTIGLINAFKNAPSTQIEIELWRFGRSSILSLMNVYAMRMAAVFTISASTIILRTAATRRWLAYLGFAVALVLLLVINLSAWTSLLFPLWVLLLSIEILVLSLRRRGEAPA